MTSAPVVFWDIDGTLVTGSMERVFIRHLRRQGVISSPSIASNFLTLALRLPLPKWYQIKLCYLRGLRAEGLNHHVESCWRETLRPALLPDAESVIQHFRSAGFQQVLLSGTILPLAKQIGKRLGISDIIAAEPEICNGVYTGRTVAEHPHGTTKVTRAEEWLSRNNHDWSNTIAIANHWEDRFLLEKCATAIAAHPDKQLRAHARTQGWQVVDTLTDIMTRQSEQKP